MARPKKLAGPSTTISLRAPPDLVQWLADLARETPDKPELTLSQAAVWAMRMGQEYRDIQASTIEVETLVRVTGRSRSDIVKQALLIGAKAMRAELKK